MTHVGMIHDASVPGLLYILTCYTVAWLLGFILTRRVGIMAAPRVVIVRPFAFLTACAVSGFMFSMLATSAFLGYLLY